MSHAPNEAVEDPTKPQKVVYQAANNRQQELLRNGVSNSGHERNCCFLNTGSGQFANVSAAAGLDHIGDGRAYAVVDWDHDGDLDIWSTNRTAPRVQLLRNNASDQYPFLSVKLQGNGTTTNRDAIGARVELVLKDKSAGKLIKTLRAGEGFLSQSSKRLHFGLGATGAIDQLLVHWPGGKVESFDDLQPNQHYLIVQGSGAANPWARPQGDIRLARTDDKQTGLGEQGRIPLRYRVPMPVLPYRTAAGDLRTLRPGSGLPTLVNLWASWCQPCLKELVEFKKKQQKLKAKGLQVIALSVDQLAEDKASNPQAARAFLERQAFPYDSGFASKDLIGKLEAVFYYLYDFRRPWAVPTSILLDRRGQLAVIYVGPVEVDQLLADVAQLQLSDAEWFESALPFAGRWTGESRHPNLTKLINTYFERDFEQDGLQLVDRFADVLVRDPDAAPLLRRLANSLKDQGQGAKAQLRLQQSIEANPNSAASHFQLSQWLVEQKKFEEAVSYCRKAVYADPEFAEAHFLLANLLHSQGQAEIALKHFHETVKLRPKLAKARYALGTVYAAQLRWNEASQQFRQAVELEPENATFHFQLGRVLQKAGRAQDAMDSYRRALEIKPAAGDVRYYLGAALAAHGKTREAILNLRRAHELQPDSLLIMNGLAWIVATADETSEQDRAEALQIAKAAAEKTNHRHPQILDTLAAAYAAVGEFDEAISAAQRAMRIATTAKSDKLVQALSERLKLYQQGQRYLEFKTAE